MKYSRRRTVTSRSCSSGCEGIRNIKDIWFRSYQLHCGRPFWENWGHSEHWLGHISPFVSKFPVGLPAPHWLEQGHHRAVWFLFLEIRCLWQHLPLCTLGLNLFWLTDLVADKRTLMFGLSVVGKIRTDILSEMSLKRCSNSLRGEKKGILAAGCRNEKVWVRNSTRVTAQPALESSQNFCPLQL